MNRRNFLTLTGTFTGGSLLLPDFLHAFGTQSNLVFGEQCLVFIQLNGGNDGLNTFIPFDNPLYHDLRPKIGISKDVIVGKTKGKVLGRNPNLSNLDKGDLKHEIDFRSVYASLLKDKMGFDAMKIGIRNEVLKGLF